MADGQFKPNVLIIEDNAINAKLLTIYLEDGGFNVIHAASGREGIDIMMKQGEDIHAVLLDRIMPDMDGLDTLKNIKLSQGANIPVIMLTAALSQAQKEEAKLVGAYACLQKPYNQEEIIATLNKSLGRT